VFFALMFALYAIFSVAEAGDRLGLPIASQQPLTHSVDTAFVSVNQAWAETRQFAAVGPVPQGYYVDVQPQQDRSVPLSWALAGAVLLGMGAYHAGRVATGAVGGNAVLTPTKAIESMADAGFKTFPIDLSKYEVPKLDVFTEKTLPAATKEQILANIQLCRDAIVSFTACGAASGYGGHTGGAYDTVPEVCMLDAMFKTKPDDFVPTFFDEAGHRVATQYLMSAINGFIEPEELMGYRRPGMPGHPELETPGVQFSSGRLGHVLPQVVGVALAHPGKNVIMLGSDGSNMEGNNAEAARLAVAQNLNVKMIVDDNDVTIAGNPSSYLKGYSVANTMRGHGMKVIEVQGEAVDDIYPALHEAMNTAGPIAVVIHRKMAPGIGELEGQTHAHDAIPVKDAVEYLKKRDLPKAIEMIEAVPKTSDPYEYKGCGKYESLRGAVADAMCNELAKLSAEERKERVISIDSDLEGSTGANKIRQKYPEMHVQSGIMERGNFSACAGFGREEGKQGLFSTFCAFSEMVISEITHARLNNSNVLSHFSHSGVDGMADNTCHFGINPMFCDNGLEGQQASPLYFPAEKFQADKMMEKIFWEPGLRFVFSLRSPVPQLLDEAGKPYYTDSYEFVRGKDDVLLEGKDGYIIAFGDALYRANDAAQRLRASGIDVGLINKPTLNILDEETTKKVGSTGFALVVEPLSSKTGVGSKYGYWLAKLNLPKMPVYDNIGINKGGEGGLWEHAYEQGYDSASIQDKVKKLHEQAKSR
jgi:transketolase